MANCEKNILEIPISATIPSSTDVVIFTQADGVSVIRTWASVLNALNPSDIEFKVGDPGAPSDGATTYQSNLLIDRRIRAFRNGIKQGTTVDANGYYISFNQSTGTVTYTPALNATELGQIEIY